MLSDSVGLNFVCAVHSSLRSGSRCAGDNPGV